MSYMRSPAFQFYPSNYLGSRAVRLMDAEQRGWYTQLLFESWESEPQATLPNDDGLLRVLAGVNTCSADVEQRWNFVKKQFRIKGKYIYNARLLEEFAKQDEFRAKRREAGRASGEARRAQREVIKTQHLSRNGSKSNKTNTRSTSVPLCSDSVRTNDEQKRTLNTPTPDSILKEEKIQRPAKTRDGRLDHPAMKAFYEVRGAYPLKAQWDFVIEALGERPDVPKMRECWKAWASHAHNPQDLVWVLDWYINGIPENKKIGARNGTSRPRIESTTERNARNLKANVEYLRSLQNDGGNADSEDAPRVLPSDSGSRRISSGG